MIEIFRFSRPLLVAGLILLPDDLGAQPSGPPVLSVEASLLQEVEGGRSPLAAALLQAAMPPLPLGYLYVGDLGRSILPTALMVGGSTLILIEVVSFVDWTDEGDSPALFYLGLGALMGGYVYGIWDAAAAARDRNARLRRGSPTLTLVPVPVPGGLELAARVSVR